jgi:dephospho-CoA kinase
LKIIGVTGGIGSGKSTVSHILQDLGAKVIDADRIAREVTRKGEPALSELVEYFGTEILNSSGELSRKKLADMVFGNQEKVDKLNEITHHHILREINSIIERLKGQENTGIIVLDVPIPVKHGFLDIVDEVWTVTADKEVRIKRIMDRSKLTQQDAVNRINAQKSDEEYIRLADNVLYNNGSVEELEKTVAHLFIQGKLG